MQNLIFMNIFYKLLLNIAFYFFTVSSILLLFCGILFTYHKWQEELSCALTWQYFTEVKQVRSWTKNLTTFNETKGNDVRTNDTMEDSELEQIRANRMAQMGAQVRPNSTNNNGYIISFFEEWTYICIPLSSRFWKSFCACSRIIGGKSENLCVRSPGLSQ